MNIRKLPLGAIALCAVSLIGLKDTGIFVDDHVQTTYSGNKVYFSVGEKAEIIEKSSNGYLVSKGKAKVTIPVDKVELTEITTIKYRVVKNVSIKDSNDKVIRNLFLGEEVLELGNRGDVLFVRCDDGVEGVVETSSLELVSKDTKKINPKKIIEEKQKSNIIKVNLLKKEEEEIRKASLVNLTKVKEISPNPVIRENDELIVNNSKAQEVISLAMEKIDTKYVYGAAGNGGYDCSGLVYAVYKNQLGINLPRSSSEQSEFGAQIERTDLQPGDLVFFNTSGAGVSHVGIYKGNGEFVHASSGKGKVIVSSLSEDYYNSRYVNATRVL